MVIYRRNTSLSHVSNNSEIVAKISFDKGETWSNERIIYNSPYDDRNLITGNLANGNIIIVFRRYDADNKITVDSGYIISSDEGKTWSNYTSIKGTEQINNQPYGNIIISKKWYGFLINYDEGVTKMYTSSNNFLSPHQKLL